jgi:hypothetical protein
MRINLFLVTTLGLGLGMATACKKADNGPGAGSSGSAAIATGGTAPSGDKAPGAIPQATGDDLSLLPARSELVMGINFQQLQQSAMWKQLVEPQLAKNMDSIEKFKAKCGFNPLETIKSISLGVSGVGAGKPTGAMVIHGLDKAKTIECISEKMKEDIAAKGTEITKDGDVVVMKDKDGMVSAMTFINADTALLALGGDKVRLAELAKGDAALKSSPMFVDMFGKLKNTDTVWGLMNGSSKVFEPAAQANIKFKAVYGSINITDAVNLAVRVRMDSADQATSLVTMAKGKAAQLKGFVDKLEITTDGNDARVDIAVSPDKLKMLMQLAGGMGGMGGGSMGGSEPAEAPPAPASP